MMKFLKVWIFWILVWGLFFSSLYGVTVTSKVEQKKVYSTQHVNPHAPVIDGRGDDPCWQKVAWGEGFTQRRPYEGKEPTQPTRFKVMYDDKNLFVLIHALDSEPNKIDRRVSRRDDGGGDQVYVMIDSYLDRRTAFAFQVNAGGSKNDFMIFENGQREDSSWDPIWEARASVDDSGWMAEMRIPFSQLRFSSGDNKVWGLEVGRFLFRKQEESLWQFIPQNAPGIVHLFGELQGFKQIKAQRQKEILPYAVAKAERFPRETGNPFATGKNQNLTGGLDGKIGLTSDLTLDFTLNPDFGQVEADPSVVNLSAYETYYQEKRPFFVEGKNIINFPLMIGDGDFSMDNLFYSRRIGRVPQYELDLEDNEYASIPMNTSILGALKLTGKARNGFSLGILDALTARESAQIDANGLQRSENVEPMTNYFTLRAQKDYHQGATVLGGMFTATNRDTRDPQLDLLHRSAYSGGFDFYHSWKKQTYYVQGSLSFSRVSGTAEAIERTQTSPVHLFQRPDADYLGVDPMRTSLSGHSGTIVAGKNGSGRLLYAAGLTWRSPGYEINDIGFLRRADTSMQFVWAQYRFLKPFSVFRNLSINFNQWMGWNFGGERTFVGGNIGFFGQLKNYWNFSFSLNRQGDALSTNVLRGGPAYKVPSGWNQYLYIGSDSRKAINGGISGGTYRSEEGMENSKYLYFTFNFRASRSLVLSLAPGLNWGVDLQQYISSQICGDQDRYILGTIDQHTLSLTIRLNWSISPDLSIQFYGQPFVSRGTYSDFKRVTVPRADRIADRFHTFSGTEIAYDSNESLYRVDENGDGNMDYAFSNPDFNVLEFRSNLVLRWEYKPGATAYLVWSQGRSDMPAIVDSSMLRGFGDLFRLPQTNVFLLKFTYAFNL